MKIYRIMKELVEQKIKLHIFSYTLNNHDNIIFVKYYLR